MTSRSRSPDKHRKLHIDFESHVIGDSPGRVYVDVQVTAYIQHREIGHALALYNKSSGQFILADVFIDGSWRGRGICTKVVEKLFRVLAKTYRPDSFFIDVRPSVNNVRACVCYISALRHVFDDHISKLEMKFENGDSLVNDNVSSGLCREGNVNINGQLVW